MKKNLSTIARTGAASLSLAAALVLGLAGVAGAHGDRSGPSRGEGALRNGPHGERGHEARIRPMLEKLDLTEAQRGKVEETLAARKDELQAARRTLAEARRALRTATHETGQSEDAIRTAALKVGEAEASAGILRAQVVQEVRALLSTEQLAELDRKRAERKERWEGQRERRGPGPGRGPEPGSGRSDL